MLAQGFDTTWLCEEASVGRIGAGSSGFQGRPEGSDLFYSVHPAVVGNFGVHGVHFICSLH